MNRIKYLAAYKLSQICKLLEFMIYRLSNFCKSLEEKTRLDIEPERNFEDTLKLLGIPIMDVSPGNAQEQIMTAIKAISHEDRICSRDRPYDGQPHTDQGERGKTLVNGLTIRDVIDCVVMGFLTSQITKDGEFLKCWDFTSGEEKCTPTEYLLGKLNEKPVKSWYLSSKVKLGTWCYNDLCSISEDYDPIAVLQNTACEIEKMMGIYPNVEKLNEIK
jgi:hypothetical protein